MKVVKNSLIYILAFFFQGSFTFLLIPVYTLYLSPVEYGALGVIISMINLLTTVYLFATHGAITRFYFDYHKNKTKMNSLLGSIFTFVIVISLFSTSALIYFQDQLTNYFLKGISFYPYIFLGLLVGLLSPYYYLFQAILQAEQRGMKNGLVSISYYLTNTILILTSLIFLKMKVEGVLLAMIATNVLFIVYLIKDFIPNFKLTVNLKILFSVLSYSMPVFVHLLSTWLIFMANRFFINNLKGTASVGIYDIGFYVGNSINVVSMAINQAYLPWFFEVMKSKRNSTASLSRFAEYAVLLYAFLAMFISLFGEEMLGIIVTDQYKEAWQLLPFTTFSYVFYGIYSFSLNPLYFYKKYTKFIPLCTFISATGNIFLNLILISWYGILGAAISMCVSMFITSALILFTTNRIGVISLQWKKMYYLTFTLLLVSLTVFTREFIVINFFLFKIIIFIVCSAVIYCLYSNQIRWFVEVIRNKLNGIAQRKF